MAVIQSGLTPGESVVTDGQMSLKDKAGLASRRPAGQGKPGARGRREARRVSLSSPFIRRPVATSLIAAAFLVFGMVAFFNLPVAALPEVDFPTIQVSASLPGASPETMASNVATPLERQFSLIAGVTQLTSTSSLGSTQVTVQFDLSRNIDSCRPGRPVGDQRRQRPAADQPAGHAQLSRRSIPPTRRS